MANTHETLSGLFTDIADAIREKTGSTEAIVADEFPEAIASISSGGNRYAGTKTHSQAFEYLMGWAPIRSVYKNYMT